MASSQRGRECVHCGNKDYFLRDGYYYCSLCQTQTQDAFEIGFDEFEVFQRTFMQSGYTAKVTKRQEQENQKTTSKKEKKPVPPLPPNALYEAYAVIIHHLGSSLIELGLRKSVKEALFRLYALYLRRRRVAFVDDADNNAAPLEPFGSKFLRVRRQRKVSRKKENEKAIKMEIDLDLDQFHYALAGETDGGAADLLADFVGIDPRGETAQAGSSGVPERKGRVMAPERETAEIPVITISSDDESDVELPADEDPQPMEFSTRPDPSLLVAFAYLACLATAHDQIFISDLIRWTKEGLLPLVDVYSLLPPHLQHPLLKHHFDSGFKIWVYRASVTSRIYRKVHWLSSYIGYTPVINFDLNFVLARVAYDLNLSKFFLPRARVIYRAASQFLQRAFRFNPTEDEIKHAMVAPVMAPEVAAIALLIVALKLTFGLDDHCEYKISELANKFNEGDDSSKQFSFSHWRLQCKLRSAVVSGESVERVLSRSWIDKRDTWLHGLLTELQRHTVIGSAVRRGVRRKRTAENGEGYENEEMDEEMERNKEDEMDASTSRGERKDMEEIVNGNLRINVEKMRRLFEKFTPFKPTDPPPLEKRQLLYPFRETVDQLKSAQENSNQRTEWDLSNVEIFQHEFFHDELSFLQDPNVSKEIQKMIGKISVGKGNSELNEFEKIFPCSRAVASTGRILSDGKTFKEIRIANMMDNEDAYEISSNLKWILNMCKERVEESLWVVFRTVQRIELWLDEDFKTTRKSGTAARILNQ